MQFGELLQIFWRQRWVVLITLVVCVVVAVGYAKTRTKTYRSTATIAFTPNAAKGTPFLAQEALLPLLDTYAEIAKSKEIEQAAAELLGHRVHGSIETATGATSAVMQISDTDTSPREAAQGARAVTEALIRYIGDGAVVTPSIVNPPVPSFTPTGPSSSVIISLAAVVGLLAGLFLALVWDRLRHTASDAGELTSLTGLPVVGRLKRERALLDAPPALVWEDPLLDISQESYRALRANLEFALERWGGRALQVTSPGPGQGKSTVTANLAVAIGQLGVPVVVVDADLRNPRQHEIFRLDNGRGLANMLLMPGSEPCVQSTRFENVSVLTSGPAPENAPELLHVRLGAILRALRTDDVVLLVDSPPVLPVSDARVIANVVDHVLLLVAADRTRVPAVTVAVERLRMAQARLVGIVLNMMPRDQELVGYRYGYGGNRGGLRRAVRAG